MGKASSAKKVARAARAGGSRRPGQRRALGFPLVVTFVVVLGTATVLFARSSRDANAAPQAGVDHWHAAYGVAQCGEFKAPLPGGMEQDRLGIHSHEDGLVHIEPLLDGAAGRNAKLELFLNFAGVTLTDSEATFPDGTTWVEGETMCGEEPGQIVVARWVDAQDAADGERPNEVLTEDFGDIRFRNDREAYTIALVAEGQLEDIPVRPDILAELNEASEPPPVDSTTVPADGDSSTTATTVPGDTTATTAVGDPAPTTATTAAPAATTATTAP